MMKKNNKKFTLDFAQQFSKQKNGRCLSKEYVNIDSKLILECKSGHQWNASFYSIKNLGTWCPHCSGRTKLTIEEMKELALSKKGLCLSTVYINSDTKLLWQCEFGHQWEAIPLSIYHHGTWCNICNGNPIITIEDMKKLAQERGGECLSSEYTHSVLNFGF